MRTPTTQSFKRLLVLGVLALFFALWGCGDEQTSIPEDQVDLTTLRVAVAANFAGVAEELAELFASVQGMKIEVISGSTGLLYGQIVNGAPFDVFLAADSERPQRLIDEGLAEPENLIAYAFGQLVLWSPNENLIDSAGQVLAQGNFEHLAIANPDLAPYGAAAREVLERFGLWERLQPKLVRGENIAQTYQFVSSGNAELGFIARSQLPEMGSYWLVPRDVHSAIEQQAVIVSASSQIELAQAFMRFLVDVEARQIIESFGYFTTND